MAKRIAQTTLNASTLDILNVIRANASAEYQDAVPKVTKATDIPKVGEVIYGTPAFANQFLNALINRIAAVRVQSATFNNPYTALKKGYIEFGETIENIFVSIAKVQEYTPEKGAEREFKRNLPDVRSVFHTMNYRTMYPVTIQDEDLKLAFLSVDGVTDLIAKIVDQIYTGAEYDEYLLFKYLLIKTISKAKMYPVSIGNGTNLNEAAVQFRKFYNQLTFMSDKYNEAHVKTNTPKDRQVIFMDSEFDAKYDVNVLAAAFNMDKATFMAKLYLIDDFTSFDNERFETIRANSDMLEEVTLDELNLLKDVKAVLVDSDFFQVYDNNNKFTEKYVASGLYWNYFYHVWKTVSYSPYANAIVFVSNTATITPPATITAEVTGKDVSETATVLTLSAEAEGATLEPHDITFEQTQELTAAGIGVQRYGALIIPSSQTATAITLKANVNGTEYTGATTLNASANVGDHVELNKG